MKRLCVPLIAIGFLFAVTVPGRAAVFDYTNPGLVINADSDLLLDDGILSTATTTGGQASGPLHIDADGYGVRGNFNDELNYDETVVVSFSERVLLDTLLLTESNGAANDLIEVRVDGLSYDFVPAFGSNHPLEMTSRATSTAISLTGNPVNLGWILEFSGLGVVGQTFTFAIPEAVQSQGSGGDYQVGGMIVTPIPEPATLVLGCVALSAIGVLTRRR